MSWAYEQGWIGRVCRFCGGPAEQHEGECRHLTFDGKPNELADQNHRPELEEETCPESEGLRQD